MTLERQKQLLQEICSEYDLETILVALTDLHGAAAVRDALPAPCPCEIESGKALADEIIAVCQQSPN